MFATVDGDRVNSVRFGKDGNVITFGDSGDEFEQWYFTETKVLIGLFGNQD